MKAASVVFKERDTEELQKGHALEYKIKEWLDNCMKESADIVVLPGLIGCIYADGGKYLDAVLKISLEYKELYICPGSYFEYQGGKTYHSSCVLMSGNICLAQRQLYLAKWEKKLGLSRGEYAAIRDINNIKTAIMLPTDLFYPQVSRHLALSGVDLVLAPAAIRGGTNASFQLSSLWQNVQQNLFFGVESGFKGRLFDSYFYSRSIIHGPLEMTDRENGFIKFENNDCIDNIITAELDNEKRKKAVKKFDTLASLNIGLYKDIFR